MVDAPRPQALTGRLLLAAGFVAAGVVAFAVGWDDYLSLAALRQHRDTLIAWQAEAPLGAATTFVLVYAAVVALSLPGAVWMTIAGGFLFGTLAGMAYSVAGASVGAVVLFLAARYVFADLCRRHAGGAVARMEAGFRRDALSYLLFLRLIPVFPFWLVNLVPAVLGVPLATFAAATVIGIIPGSFVYALVGNGLGAVLDAGGEPDVAVLFAPEVLAPLVGLAALALAPVAYRAWRSRHPAAGGRENGR
jgi:uncharacterized membrane protein YdjX (TVP38/TMEM64 family)